MVHFPEYMHISIKSMCVVAMHSKKMLVKYWEIISTLIGSLGLLQKRISLSVLTNKLPFN